MKFGVSFQLAFGKELRSVLELGSGLGFRLGDMCISRSLPLIDFSYNVREVHEFLMQTNVFRFLEEHIALAVLYQEARHIIVSPRLRLRNIFLAYKFV